MALEIKNLLNSFRSELTNNILKFWLEHSLDFNNGGFYGYISNDMLIDTNHNKSSVLNFRILWTFAAAYRHYGDEKYLMTAQRAYDYAVENFMDQEYSGIYWMLDFRGNPADTTKKTYSIAFAIYALSEFYRATGKKESLSHAIELYNTLELHSHDPVSKGYAEVFSRDWSTPGNARSSYADINMTKSMNTHLHVLEAYTNLYRVWKNDKLANSLHELINITLDHIIDPLTFQFRLYFDNYWTPLSKAVSYGHDIEGSWLLYEAAEVLGNQALLVKVRVTSVLMAKKVFSDGIDKINGGLFYEKKHGILKDFKEWWAQAEAVVGFTNAYQLSGLVTFLREALNTWSFISSHLIDHKHGEWFWGTTADGSRVIHTEKVGPWKCPYHNSRMCFEMLDRLTKIAADNEALFA